MKTHNEIKQFFKTQKGLEYIDMYIFPNNSCYRGQMKKVSDLSPQEQVMVVDMDNKDYIRHGFGLQYWVDGAHYEGEWFLNKAQG